MPESTVDIQHQTPQWFVLRDLRRSNTKVLGFMELAEAGFETFTPLKWVVEERRGKRVRRQKPVVADLLFVHTTRESLDPVLQRSSSIQYRYVRGAYCKPMTVPDSDMQRFIHAVTVSAAPAYYSIDEVDTLSIGHTARVIGGPLDGLEGRILKVKGARKKRLLIEIPSFVAAVVEVEPEFIQIID